MHFCSLGVPQNISGLPKGFRKHSYLPKGIRKEKKVEKHCHISTMFNWINDRVYFLLVKNICFSLFQGSTTILL
jgi:hypothetical protein